MMHKAWHSIEELPYCFLRSSIKFPGHMGPKINDLNRILSKNTRPVAAIKSLRFALLMWRKYINSLWPSDTIWWHISMSTLAQVMTYCLNQWWLIISGMKLENNLIWIAEESNSWSEFVNRTSPRAQWVKALSPSDMASWELVSIHVVAYHHYTPIHYWNQCQLTSKQEHISMMLFL